MSSNLKHILFATDGSDFSSGAQRVAIDLAKRCGARLTVMTIVLTTQDLEGVGTHGLREQMEREAQARIDTVVDAAKSAGVACDTQLVYGEEPHHEIVNTAAELKPDLVVLGRRGKRGLARLMVGHATAHVAGHAPCNVLMVPRAGQVWNQRILLATDGSTHGEAAARAAQAVASQCSLPVTVVSATTKSHSAERKAEARATADRVATALKAAGIASESVVAEGRPDEVVIETAASSKADLIVVGSHGRTGLSRLILGSISERIMGQAQCPVLIARAAT
ncbi:MAG TPA: universal stress protein [Thiobacillaceae bacterium]|nr:universal stress protein [Thiobacillaceae bacterium]HNA81797.1 universal stress protein [Thiobacillaceae bacterium]